MTVHNVYFFLAVCASALLSIQLIMAFLGIDGHDHDVHHDSSQDSHEFHLISIRSITAFFAMFGWSGLAMLKDQHGLLSTLVISFLIGFVPMLFISWLLYFVSKKAVAAQLDYNEAVGKNAMIYMRIPGGNDFGLVNVVVGGKKMILKAKADQMIPTGAEVKVLSHTDGIYKVAEI